jgi:hypothetical protein
MSFPQEVPFNPYVSKVPILGASSGNPKSFQDPKSVASIGANIQAMADQAQADTLYDAKIPEGFRGFRGFRGSRSRSLVTKDPRIAALYILGLALIVGSLMK